MNNEINLADIRAFVVIAQSGSFTDAAELLNCSRSHLSKQLLQLETMLAVKLITRTTRSQRLTEQGKLLFEQCTRSLLSIENAVAEVIDHASSTKGLLNINCVGGYIGEDIIAPLVNDFISQHPQISVNLDFTSQRVDLISGEFDFVFRMGNLTDSNLIARKLADLAIGTFASPNYLAGHGQPNEPKDLKNHQCITGSVKQWAFTDTQTTTKKVEVIVNGHFQCKNGRAMKNSALAGNGIVRLPLLYCQQELNTGLLVPVFSQWQVPHTPLYLVYLQNKFQPARLKLFVEFVQQHLPTYLNLTSA